MVQNILHQLFPNSQITNVFDEQCVTLIKQLQSENGLVPTGNVDQETWLLLQSLVGNINQPDSDFSFKYTIAPGTYDIDTNNPLVDQLSNYLVNISCSNSITCKQSIIAKYPNGNSKTFTEDITENSLELSPANLQRALVYNIQEGSAPISIEWIVCPYNHKPYKWTFNLK